MAGDAENSGQGSEGGAEGGVVGPKAAGVTANFPVYMGMVPTFSGSKDGIPVKDFLDTLEEIGILDNWGEHEKLVVLKFRCEGEAKEFLVEQVEENPQVKYGELRKALQSRFTTVEQLTTRLAEFMACRQSSSQSVKQFASKLERLSRKSFGPRKKGSEEMRMSADQYLLSKFVDGLIPQIRRPLLSHQPKSYEEAKRLAVVEEENEATMLSSSPGKVRVVSSDTVENPPWEKSMRELMMVVQSLAEKVDDVQKSQSSVQESSGGSIFSQERCRDAPGEWNSGDRGSSSFSRFTEAPSRFGSRPRFNNPPVQSPRGQFSANRSTVTCYRCRALGHYANECGAGNVQFQSRSNSNFERRGHLENSAQRGNNSRNRNSGSGRPSQSSSVSKRSLNLVQGKGSSKHQAYAKPCRFCNKAPIESCYSGDAQVGMPVVMGKVNGHPMRFLVDSGATISITSRECIKSLPGSKNFVRKNPTVVVKGISGQQLDIVTCVELQLCIAEDNFDFDIYVTESRLSSSYDFILGYDILKSRRFVFDAEADTLLKKKKVEHINSVEQEQLLVFINDYFHEKKVKVVKVQNCEKNFKSGATQSKHVTQTEHDTQTEHEEETVPKQTGVSPVVYEVQRECQSQSANLQSENAASEVSHVKDGKRKPSKRNSKRKERVFFGKSVAKQIIPPLSEKVINVKIPENEKLGEFMLLQPVECLKREMLLVSNSVNKTDESGLACIRVLNLSEEPHHINKHTKLITAEPISVRQVNCLQREENGGESQQNDFDVSHLPLHQKKPLLKLLKQYQHIFAKSVLELGDCDTLLHEIHLTSDIPVRQKPYRVPYALRPEMDRQVNELLEAGIIEPSTSPYAAPVLLVKKSDGSHRLVVDFRRINRITLPEAFPIPNLMEMIDSLAGAKYFTCLDMTSGFHQLKIHPADVHKTSFVTEFGQFQYLKLCFGLRNSPSAFQRLMEIVLAGLKPLQIAVYIDDIVIASKEFQEHLDKLKLVFERLDQHNLKLKPSKCHFLKSSVRYLGFMVSQEGISPDPSNLEVVKNFKTPESVKSVRAFLGLTGFYRRFIQDYAKVALPLTSLVKKAPKFIWSSEAEDAFQCLKQALLKEPCLRLPDLEKHFTVACDASKFALGAVLQQTDEDGKLFPVAYASRKLKGPEINYSTVEKEMLAVVFAVSYFRQFLYARHFTIITDQASLSYVFKLKDPTSRIARWCMTLQQYDYSIIHKPGSSNLVADYLSRHVQACEPEVEGIKLIQDTDRVKKLQREDEKWSSIIQNLEKGGVKGQVKVSDEFFLEDGVLCHFALPKSGSPRNHPIEQVVLPESMITEILSKCHDSIAVAHPGFLRTFQRIRSQFFFPNMYSVVKNYVETCSSCLEKRGYNPKKKAGLIRAELTSRPFERISMDILGPLPFTKSGNRYLLVMSDYFTRWPEAFALSDTKSETIARVLVEKVISVHGVPEKILTDRGSNFLSKAITQVYEKLGIEKQNTSSYHPSANGLVERLNSTLVQALSHLVDEAQDNWDEVVPFALLAIRTSVHSSTGETPAFLTFGRDPLLPYHLLGKPTHRTYASQLEYAEELTNNLNHAFNVVKQNLEKAAELQEKQRAKTAVDKKITVGSRVYLYTPAVKVGRTKKLKRLCTGPFRVTRQFSNVNFEITDIKKPRRKEVVHVDRLTKIRDRISFPVPEEDSDISSSPKVVTPNSQDIPKDVTEKSKAFQMPAGAKFDIDPKILLPWLTRRQQEEARERSQARASTSSGDVPTPAAEGGTDSSASVPHTHPYQLRPRDERGFVIPPR